MRLPSGQGSRGGRRRREDDADATQQGAYGRGRTPLVGGGQREYGADRGARANQERGDRPQYPPRTGLVGGAGSGRGGPGYAPASYGPPGYGGVGNDGSGYGSVGYGEAGNGGPSYNGGPGSDGVLGGEGRSLDGAGYGLADGGPRYGGPAHAGSGYPGSGFPGPGYPGPDYDGATYAGPAYAGPGDVGPGYSNPGYDGATYADPAYAGPGYPGSGSPGPGHGGPAYPGPGYADQAYDGPGYPGSGDVGLGHDGPAYAGPGYAVQGYDGATYADPAYAVPGYPGPGHADPAYPDPAYAGPSYVDPAYVDPAYPGPAYQDPAYQDPAYQDPAYADLAYAAPALPGAAYPYDGDDGRNGGRAGRRAPGSPYGSDAPEPQGWSGPKHRPVRQRHYRRGRGAVGRFLAIPAPVLAGAAVVACVVMVLAGVGLSRATGRAPAPAVAAAADNANCTLIVPENPLSALGLATPYLLAATNPAQGACHEANADQTAFVQGAIINTTTGQISIYDPLVIDQGSTPAVAPVVPKLPMNSVVALWFGYNGDNLTLAGADQMFGLSPSQPMSASLSASVGSRGAGGFEFPAASPTSDFLLQQADCVSGEDIKGKFSTFTQVAACNAPAFFAAANAAIAAGRLTVPSPGTAVDGQSCLTTRSFALVDQDQSDNVTSEYLAERNGQVAQDTAANRQSLPTASVLFNGSDNGLLDLFIDPALHCSPWELPNEADNGALTSALPLDELQAATWAGQQQSGPIALVPLNDPMTLGDNGGFNAGKTDTYRSIVDMAPLPAGESPGQYCTDLEQIQGSRLQQDVNLLVKGPSPAADEADNLFTFMAMRLQQSFVNLHCASLGQANDVSTTVNRAGVVVAACFVNQVAPLTPGAGNPMARRKTCPAKTG